MSNAEFKQFLAGLTESEKMELISAINYYGDNDHPKVTEENAHCLNNPIYVAHCLGRKYRHTMGSQWSVEDELLEPTLREYKRMHGDLIDKLHTFFTYDMETLYALRKGKAKVIPA
jgi:hypothetical protein